MVWQRSRINRAERPGWPPVRNSARYSGSAAQPNWFIVLWTPPALSAASPAKYSL